jgi:hypothetical protein
MDHKSTKKTASTTTNNPKDCKVLGVGAKPKSDTCVPPFDLSRLEPKKKVSPPNDSSDSPSSRKTEMHYLNRLAVLYREQAQKIEALSEANITQEMYLIRHVQHQRLSSTRLFERLAKDIHKRLDVVEATTAKCQSVLKEVVEQQRRLEEKYDYDSSSGPEPPLIAQSDWDAMFTPAPDEPNTSDDTYVEETWD